MDLGCEGRDSVVLHDPLGRAAPTNRAYDVVRSPRNLKTRLLARPRARPATGRGRTFVRCIRTRPAVDPQHDSSRRFSPCSNHTRSSRWRQSSCKRSTRRTSCAWPRERGRDHPSQLSRRFGLDAHPDELSHERRRLVVIARRRRGTVGAVAQGAPPVPSLRPISSTAVSPRAVTPRVIPVLPPSCADLTAAHDETRLLAGSSGAR